MPGLKPSRRRGQSGFTLIELVVSISLVAAISAGMLMAMRNALLTMERTGARLEENRRAVGIAQMVRRQLGGAMPVTGDCSTGGQAARVPVFRGDTAGFVMVTSFSMTEGSRGHPRIVQYQALPEPGGTFRLIANEYPFSGPASTLPYCLAVGRVPAQAGPESFVVAEGLAAVRILYQQRNPLSMLGEGWLAEWRPPELPAAIRIEMTPAAVDPRRMQLPSITVPIHVNRYYQEQYDDLP